MDVYLFLHCGTAALLSVEGTQKVNTVPAIWSISDFSFLGTKKLPSSGETYMRAEFNATKT